MKNAPKNCKLDDGKKIPEGRYKVMFARHGDLYVLVGENIVKIKNPYDTIPTYVSLSKYKGVWKIKETKEIKGDKRNET